MAVQSVLMFHLVISALENRGLAVLIAIGTPDGKQIKAWNYLSSLISTASLA